MSTTADILFGVTGQALSLRIVQGQPSSASFEVFDDTMADDGEPEFSGVATVDSLSTTLSSASGPQESDPYRLDLASVAGIEVGRKYLLSDGGMRSWVEPVEIGDDYIRARHPLTADYGAGATLSSTYVEAAVDDTWAADEHHLSDHSDPHPDYRVRWSVVVDGTSTVLYSFFRLLRGRVEHGVTLSDIEPRFPGLRHALPLDMRDEEGRPILDAAWVRVQSDLARLGQDDQGLRSPDALRELMILTTLRTLAEAGKSPEGMALETFLEVATRNHERYLEQEFQVGQQPTAHGTGGDASMPIVGGFWSK